MNYPIGDEQFEDKVVKTVEVSGDGWVISFVDGWSFFVPAGVEPKVGSAARLYGRGIGYTVRGLFIDGVESFYRTEEGAKEKHLKDTYGETAAEWLRRWDDNQSCWSISMGGFGPGYEQALQLCMVEFLRYLVAEAPNAELWDNEGEWKILLKRLDEYEDANRVIRKLGPSGAMVGAAKSLAVKMYRYTPIGVMQNDQVKDRHIQVSKNFPSVD